MAESIDKYIASKESSGRIQILADAKKSQETWPLFLVEDLLCLNIPIIEKMSLLDLVSSRSGLALEDFLLERMNHWDQDLSAYALRRWADGTDHFLWFRLIDISKDKHLSQRIQYTILDQCSPFCGKLVIESFQSKESLFELSAAFHALLFQRSMERCVFSKNLDQLALFCVEELKRSATPDNKALVLATAWLVHHSVDDAEKLARSFSLPAGWRDVIFSMLYLQDTMHKDSKKFTKRILQALKSEDVNLLHANWPSLFFRSYLEVETVSQCLIFMASNASVKNEYKFFEPMFAGISEDVLVAALDLIEDDLLFVQSLMHVSKVIDVPLRDGIIQRLSKSLHDSSNPEILLSKLDLRMRLQLTKDNDDRSSIYENLFKEEDSVLSGSGKKILYKYSEIAGKNDEEYEKYFGRKLFFDIAYREKHIQEGFLDKKRLNETDEFWMDLAWQWLTPTENLLPELAKTARTIPNLFNLCYIDTLGRYQGSDVAALKLLDFIRSSEETVMRCVINSLFGIGTPRTLQELISCITRPNVSMLLKIEICNRLVNFDLDKLQSELRSAIEDLNLSLADSEEAKELMEAISNLLVPVTSKSRGERSDVSITSDGKELDNVLIKKIPHYAELSSEVKRALRTAQFFDDQINASKAADMIDLSPVIDMQYKALELLFRESFEEFSFSIINDGILQRKLDIIGYARPIPKAMDEFERYIGDLPVVQTIPYFSKFKLRKMLRAICQFRPGKRFTLDGIKAFALFFICFGRKECRFSLNGIMDLGFSSDTELFEFGKSLHMFQDFRNRAAHEGFHPDAQHNIDGIWISTAEIIDTAFKVRKSCQNLIAFNQPRVQKREPVIEYKGSKNSKVS
ncbi:MAG: hypothetical protein R3B45_02855 [Bdellovibrionota bacterium]